MAAVQREIMDSYVINDNPRIGAPKKKKTFLVSHNDQSGVTDFEKG